MADIDAFRPQLEAALEYADGSHTFEDVARLVAEGNMQFWPGTTSAVVTEIINYPRKKTLNFFLAGGDLAELERMSPIILQWGRSVGCTHAAFCGRPGWERTFLTRTGWQKSNMVVLEKPLDE